MARYIFSADGHVREPRDLFSAALPERMVKFAPRTVRDEEYMKVFAGDKLMLRMRLAKNGKEDFTANTRRGGEDLKLRIEDLDQEGIHGEIVFPTLGMNIFLLEDRETEIACCEIYNNWIQHYFAGHYDRFVRCGVLPMLNFDDTVHEMERIAKLGFTSAMLPSAIPPGMPQYNDPRWDQVFDAAQRLEMVLVMHTATGIETLQRARGPGASVINYTMQMNDAALSLTYMVGGGLLDRFPKAKVAVIECGASWLDGLAERLDEVYFGHHMFVNPKLSVKPSEVIKRQVAISFQFDRGCIMSRSVTGTEGLMWASDYPHHEGTFPHSQQVIAHLFDGVDISETEKDDILGLNGARLFRLPLPTWAKAAA